ncbi:hypothetical protein HDV05_005563 [Chytridiales sp. JEL 0842]|nr:hypothetical protein HDV05_005563 [Chytridiales sp. JEL 0842]
MVMENHPIGWMSRKDPIKVTSFQTATTAAADINNCCYTTSTLPSTDPSTAQPFQWLNLTAQNPKLQSNPAQAAIAPLTVTFQPGTVFLPGSQPLPKPLMASSPPPSCSMEPDGVSFVCVGTKDVGFKISGGASLYPAFVKMGSDVCSGSSTCQLAVPDTGGTSGASSLINLGPIGSQPLWFVIVMSIVIAAFVGGVGWILYRRTAHGSRNFDEETLRKHGGNEAMYNNTSGAASPAAKPKGGWFKRRRQPDDNVDYDRENSDVGSSAAATSPAAHSRKAPLLPTIPRLSMDVDSIDSHSKRSVAAKQRNPEVSHMNYTIPSLSRSHRSSTSHNNKQSDSSAHNERMDDDADFTYPSHKKPGMDLGSGLAGSGFFESAGVAPVGSVVKIEEDSLFSGDFATGASSKSGTLRSQRSRGKSPGRRSFEGEDDILSPPEYIARVGENLYPPSPNNKSSATTRGRSPHPTDEGSDSRMKSLDRKRTAAGNRQSDHEPITKSSTLERKKSTRHEKPPLVPLVSLEPTNTPTNPHTHSSLPRRQPSTKRAPGKPLVDLSTPNTLLSSSHPPTNTLISLIDQRLPATTNTPSGSSAAMLRHNAPSPSPTVVPKEEENDQRTLPATSNEAIAKALETLQRRKSSKSQRQRSKSRGRRGASPGLSSSSDEDDRKQHTKKKKGARADDEEEDDSMYPPADDIERYGTGYITPGRKDMSRRGSAKSVSSPQSGSLSRKKSKSRKREEEEDDEDVPLASVALAALQNNMRD